MTMTYCRSCGEDVHITHGDDDCPEGDANLRVPDELRGPPEPVEEEGER